MKDRKIQNRKRYLFAFLIGTILFILIFVLSYSLSYLQYQRISDFQEDIAYQIFEDKLDYSLFAENICSNDYYSKISEDLGVQGKIIDDLEKKLGKNDRRVLFRKKFYSLIELEHFEFVKILNEKCNLGIHTILFFYSNEKNDIKKSEDTGDLLSVTYRRNNDLLIYSFDINLDSDLIDKLKEKYSIEESPTIVIDEDIKIVDPKNVNDIEKYLD